MTSFTESTEINATASGSSSSERTAYDVIGDVHGCASELKELLHELGYRVSETSGAYEHPERFRIQVVQPAPALRRPELKLTVDIPDDLAAMREIFTQLGREGHLVELGEVIALLDARPELRSHFTGSP